MIKKLGNTSEERQKNFEEMVYLYNEKNLTLDDIGKRFNVSRQAVSQFMFKRGFTPSKEKDIKFKRYSERAKGTVLEEKLRIITRARDNERIYKYRALKIAREYKQSLKDIKNLILDFENCYGTGFKQIEEILQKCEVLND